MAGKKAHWMRSGGWILSAMALVLALGALAPESDARSDARIYNLRGGRAKIFGTSVSDWTAQWWQWALSIPVSANPLFDTTGERVEHGQRGPVWFLGGSFVESNGVVRTATIPAGKALLFPVSNHLMDNVGLGEPLTPEEMRVVVDDVLSALDLETMSLTVDGVEVPNLQEGRVDSPVFSYWMPEGNVYQAFDVNAPRGIYAPAVTGGYWVVLKPLAVGEHSIHFFASRDGFVLDITYNLTVVESNQP